MITMPVWVFLLLLVGLVVWNVFLMWANNDQARVIRRQRRRRMVHDHLHHNGPAPAEIADLVAGAISSTSAGGGQ